MKTSLWTFTLLLPVLAQCSYADSVTTFTTQANILFITNEGGDNQDATFQAPQISLGGSGDVSCSWCSFADVSLTPGSFLVPSTYPTGVDWVAVFGHVIIGGQGYACTGENCSLFATGITALRGFTFPTNGQNFTVTVPARINGPITGGLGNGQLFDLQIPTGQLVLTFDFVPAQFGVPAYYEFTKGAFTTPGFQPTPEPGTLGLMASGLIGILGIGLKTRKYKRFPNSTL